MPCRFWLTDSIGLMTTEVEIVPIGKPSAAQDGVDRRATAARWLLLSPAVAVVSIIGVAPMAIILVYSFLRPGYYGGVEWTFNFENYIQFLFTRDLFDETLSFDPAYLAIFGRSALQAGFATFASLLLGFPTAYYIATRRPRWRNMLAFLITIPFWTNLLIRTYAMLLLLRDDGLINSLLLATGVIKHPLQMVYTDFAIAVGLVYTYLPFMVLPIYAAIERLDFRLVEAGFDLYATRAQVLRRIIIPIARPGIIAGALLVFIPSLGTYITAVLLGGGRKLMIGNLIANQFGESRNWPLGSALTMILLVCVVAALLIYIRQMPKQVRHG
jgi:spermidine/putrescine transport system permease protein